MTKYHARKTEVNGIVFDSKLEAERYQQLMLLEKAGEISGLMLQVEFQILKGFVNPETGEKIKSRHYVADFVYNDRETGAWVIEDTKGIETSDFRLKWDYMKSEYPEYRFKKVTRDMV